MFLLVIQRLFIEFALHVLYFPIWWYTAGAKRAFFGCVHLWQDANRNLSPGLWLKNLFVPMFGQTDWQGRIMSIFIRFMNVLFRSIALLIWSCGIILLFLVWLLFPIVVISLFLQALFVQ